MTRFFLAEQLEFFIGWTPKPNADRRGNSNARETEINYKQNGTRKMIPSRMTREKAFMRDKYTVLCNSRTMTSRDFPCRTTCAWTINSSGTAETGINGLLLAITPRIRSRTCITRRILAALLLNDDEPPPDERPAPKVPPPPMLPD
uniref:Uncharacterized protein n=1 Tax=Romanomermis culicivorax TaxID=13658 RepID=A0A915IUS4_ROMCU